MVGTGAYAWTGGDWERYVLSLLFLSYPPGTIQEVPAKDRGDLGIDAFSLDGQVFQCYAAEEPLSVSELYAKQRKKMSTDLKKLETKAAGIKTLLGSSKIRLWIFLVPRLDSKEIISHATKKSLEMRAKQLDHLDASFQIIVQTAAAFPDAVSKLRESAINEIRLDIPLPSPEDVSGLMATESHLVQNLDRKLTKLPGITAGATLDKLRQAFLEAYIRRTAISSLLWEHHPILQTDVQKEIDLAEQRLPLKYGPVTGQVRIAPRDVATDLANAIGALLPGYGPEVAEDVALGTVGDWLMRCPLDWSEG